MKLDALSNRLEALEARIKPIDPTADFLAKCSDEELVLMLDVLTAEEDGRELEHMPEQDRMLTALQESMWNEGIITEEDLKN